MQFLLFDVTATLLFLAGYRAVVAIQRRRVPARRAEPRTASGGPIAAPGVAAPQLSEVASPG